MKRLKLAGILAFVVAMSLAAAACGGDEEAAPPAPPPAEEPPAEEPPGVSPSGETVGTPTAEEPPAEEPAEQTGGVYRVDWEASFDFSNGFDPVGEYLAEAFGIYSSLLIRTLVGYRHVAGPPGNEIIPDLAVDLPEVSEDGLTYTFTLKDGIKFGPPLSREITSADVIYAFERIGTESLVAQYRGYYQTIEGMPEFLAGEADTITGITAPDDKTVVFKLTAPTGDFLYRMAMPAAGPAPKEVAGCFDLATEYGRYVISSGPYMIEGSDALDATGCDTLEPLSGFDPESFLTLVRNPDYDPATDTLEARENLPDRFEFTINTNTDDIYNKIKAGEIEDAIAGEPAKVLKEYSESDDLKDNLHISGGDRTWYVTMNLTQPPFDDVHVRKAVNLIMDKEGLRRAWGGPLFGELAGHTIPDIMLNETLADYNPYATEGDAGDEELAKAEMAQSKYDTDQDGLCDAPECDGVLHVAGTRDIDKNMIPVMESSLAKIGITLTTRTFDDAYTVIQTVKRDVPISSRPGWGKDYADTSTFAVLFDGRLILPTGNFNYSLVGLTPEQAPKVDASGSIEGIPSVDADIDACNAIPLGDERTACWGALDQKLMEEVVPWVPYLDANAIQVTSDAVIKWDFDQFSGTIGYAHVAVDPSLQ